MDKVLKKSSPGDHLFKTILIKKNKKTIKYYRAETPSSLNSSFLPAISQGKEKDDLEIFEKLIGKKVQNSQEEYLVYLFTATIIISEPPSLYCPLRYQLMIIKSFQSENPLKPHFISSLVYLLEIFIFICV